MARREQQSAASLFLLPSLLPALDFSLSSILVFFSYMAFTWPFYLCSRGQENHRHDRGTMTSDCLDWNLTVICNCSWLRKNDVVSNSFSKVGSLMDHFLEGIALLRYKILVHQPE